MVMCSFAGLGVTVTSKLFSSDFTLASVAMPVIGMTTRGVVELLRIMMESVYAPLADGLKMTCSDALDDSVSEWVSASEAAILNGACGDWMVSNKVAANAVELVTVNVSVSRSPTFIFPKSKWDEFFVRTGT